MNLNTLTFVGLLLVAMSTHAQDSNDYWATGEMGQNSQLPELSLPTDDAGNEVPNTGSAANEKTTTPAPSMNMELSLATTGAAPDLIPVRHVPQQSPVVAPKSVLFVPADFRHRRLLFEQPLLERHGLTTNERLQPLVSGAHFFGSALLFPFELAKHHHRWCDSSLGWGMPGSLQFGCKRH